MLVTSVHLFEGQNQIQLPVSNSGGMAPYKASGVHFVVHPLLVLAGLQSGVGQLVTVTV